MDEGLEGRIPLIQSSEDEQTDKRCDGTDEERPFTATTIINNISKKVSRFRDYII